MSRASGILSSRCNCDNLMENKTALQTPKIVLKIHTQMTKLTIFEDDNHDEDAYDNNNRSETQNYHEYQY